MASNSLGVDLFTPDNPLSPLLSIKLDGKIYDLDVNFIRSLTVERATDTLGSFEFVIEDTMDLSLEQKFMKLIMEEVNDLSFQYGWSNGDKSPWYCGKIWCFRAKSTCENSRLGYSKDLSSSWSCIIRRY